MTYSIPMPCIIQGCINEAVNDGRCAKHQRPIKYYNNQRSKRLPADWKDRQAYVIKRDSRYCDIHKRVHAYCYICHECGADGVDHIINNDNNQYDNLAAIHHNTRNSHGIICHNVKTQQEAIQGRRNARVVKSGSIKPF